MNVDRLVLVCMPFDELHRFLHICQLRVREVNGRHAMLLNAGGFVATLRTGVLKARIHDTPDTFVSKPRDVAGEWQRTDDDMVAESLFICIHE